MVHKVHIVRGSLCLNTLRPEVGTCMSFACIISPPNGRNAESPSSEQGGDSERMPLGDFKKPRQRHPRRILLTMGDYGDINDAIFGPGDPLAGYPRGIIVQRPPREAPATRVVEGKVDERIVKNLVDDLLNNEDELGKRAAENLALKQRLEELIRKAAQDAASDAVSKAARLAARSAYLSRQTILPPNENLSLSDINLIKTFIRSPGIGPFVFLSMFFSYGGLVDELNHETVTRDDEEMIRLKSPNMPVSKINEFFFGQYEIAAKKEDDDDDVATELVWAPQISLLPIGMLILQLVFIFFIFYEAYKKYVAGLCPGYVTDQNTQAAYPIGAGTAARILMAFISAFFCVRVVQQFLLFRHALEGEQKDGDVHDENRPSFWARCNPFGAETWLQLYNDADKKLLIAIQRLDQVHDLRQNSPSTPSTQAPVTSQIGTTMASLQQQNGGGAQTQNVLTDYHKGIISTLNKLYQDYRNLSDLAFASDYGRMETMKIQIVGLKDKFVQAGLLPEKFAVEKFMTKQTALDKQLAKREIAKRNADLIGWRNVKWSWLFPFFILDCWFQLIVMILIFLVNLYIVFIDGVASRDMVLNVVLLDFIFEQLPKFKSHLFKSDKAKAVVRTLKLAFHDPPKSSTWKGLCHVVKAIGLKLVMLFSILAFLISFAMIIFGPVCKPGPLTAGSLPQVATNN